ncbi:condensation domain-containing protein [Streptomyces sp. NPDC054765]
MIPATDRRPDLRRRGAIEAPLSSSQRGLWFLHAADPHLSASAVPLLLRFPRRVAVRALRTALAALPARHEPLRTHYPLRDDEPVQRILPPGPAPLRVVDLTGVPQAAERAVREATTAAAEPFRLTEEPPLRCSLWHDPAGEDLLLICLHHISVDGWSLSVLVEELLQLYAAAAAGTEPDLPPPALQPADFAAWEHEEHRTSAYTALLDARIERLRPLPTQLRPGPAALKTGAGERGRAQRAVRLPASGDHCLPAAGPTRRRGPGWTWSPTSGRVSATGSWRSPTGSPGSPTRPRR